MTIVKFQAKDTIGSMYTAIIGIAGTVIGLLLGHILTVAREHQKWLADQQKAEYREIIDLLYDTITIVTRCRPGVERPADSTPINEAVQKLARSFEDRIFIAKQIRESGAYDDWLAVKKTPFYDAELYNQTPPEDRYIAP